jgi:hypothetical protein
MKYIDIMPQLEKSGTKDLSTQIFAVVLFGTFPPPSSPVSWDRHSQRE